MVNKNKHNTLHSIEIFAAHSGVAVMMAAVMISMAELAERGSHRVVASASSAHAAASSRTVHVQTETGSEPFRRAKEEIRHSSATFGELRRSHFTAGTI